MNDFINTEQPPDMEVPELKDDFPFLIITSIDNAIDNLETIGFFLRINDTHWRWKWCVIAAHQALYSFAICALEGTAPILTVTQRDIRKYPKVAPSHVIGACHAWRAEGFTNAQILDRLESIAMVSGQYSVSNLISEKTVAKWLTKSPQLIGINEALRRLRAADYLQWNNSERLVLSEAEKQAIDSLISEFRNEFEHYIPRSWLIHTELFPPMLRHVLRVIRFIALESNNVISHKDEHQKRVIAALDEIETRLDAVAPNGVAVATIE